MKFDVLVVGAGLAGAVVAERAATVYGKRVLVIDRRMHVAGNTYDEHDQHGVLVHRYGAHIFNTSSEKVWAYVRQFGEFSSYQHRVLGWIDGQLVPIPFNLTSVEKLYPAAEAQRLVSALFASYGYGSRLSVLDLMSSSDADLKQLGDLIYRSVFEFYSQKQWGVNLETLDRSVGGKVPVVVSHDDRYFRSRYQGVPLKGYTELVRKMLDSPLIRVFLGVDWKDIKGHVSYGHLVFSGCIDEYFDHMEGTLPYRTVRFESRFEESGGELIQEAAVVNYPQHEEFTRVVEHRWLTGQRHSGSTRTWEFPAAYTGIGDEPYYPVPSQQSRRIYERYRALSVTNEAHFTGRLGGYQYLNMDQVVAQSLKLADVLFSPRKIG